MFGSSDSQQDNGTSDMMQAAQAGDNNSGYGMPMPSSPATGSAPAMSDTNNLPPADELAAGSDQPSTARDLHAQTPEELISIKQDALQSLKPLIGHLDQSAEEHFRTTMMMIQASDDQSLIPEAYEAAKAIEDEKARAQALLDVVNEINYFTQMANKQ